MTKIEDLRLVWPCFLQVSVHIETVAKIIPPYSEMCWMKRPLLRLYDWLVTLHLVNYISWNTLPFHFA